MDYKQKYLKYKSKYLSLKNQFGGATAAGSPAREPLTNDTSPGRRFEPLTNTTIRYAVKDYLNDATKAEVIARFGPIEEWNTSQVTDMSHMFERAESFNQDISGWDTRRVTDMSNMFSAAESFNQDISGWDTRQVTDMSNMFSVATSFNQDIGKGNWNTERVTNMMGMFVLARSFNQDISGWDTRRVTNMWMMFMGAQSFNQDISRWITSQVTDMSRMFYYAHDFNQDISGWDTSNVEDGKKHNYVKPLNCRVLRSFGSPPICNDGMDPVTHDPIEEDDAPERYYQFDDTKHCIRVNTWNQLQNYPGQRGKNPISRNDTNCINGVPIR